MDKKLLCGLCGEINSVNHCKSVSEFLDVPYVVSFGRRQNSTATPYAVSPAAGFGWVGFMRSVRSSFAKLDILPRRSNWPDFGPMASSTSTIFPRWHRQSEVLKYRPPGLAFTARPWHESLPLSPAGRQQSWKCTSTLARLRFSITASFPFLWVRTTDNVQSTCQRTRFCDTLN